MTALTGARGGREFVGRVCDDSFREGIECILVPAVRVSDEDAHVNAEIVCASGFGLRGATAGRFIDF